MQLGSLFAFFSKNRALLVLAAFASRNLYAQQATHTIRAQPITREATVRAPQRTQSCLQNHIPPPKLVKIQAFEVERSKPIIRGAGKLFSGIAWNTIFVGANNEKTQQKRQTLIYNSIIKAAQEEPVLREHLSSREITDAATRIAKKHSGSNKVPKPIEIEREVISSFVNLIIDKNLQSLGLPCSSKELDQIRNISLSEFDSCLAITDNSNNFAICVNQMSKDGPYKIGHLALQVMVKDLLKDQNLLPNEINALVKRTIDKYDHCSKNLILKANDDDVLKLLKLCVSSSALEAVRSVTEKTLKENFLNQGFSNSDAEQSIRKILNGLNNNNCPLTPFFQSNVSPTYNNLKSLNTYFSGRQDDIARFQNAAYKCVNHISLEAGKTIIPRALAQEPLIQEHLQNRAQQIRQQSPHISEDQALSQARQELNTRFVDNVFVSCVQNLQKNNPNSLVNPLDCEDNLRAQMGAHLIQTQLPESLDKAFQTLPSEKITPIKKSALEHFNQCRQTSTSEAETVGCLKSSLENALPNLALESANHQMGRDISQIIPNAQAEIRSISRQCLQDSLGTVHTFQDLSLQVDSLQEQCGQRITGFIAPKVAPHIVSEKLKEQNIDPTEFLKTSAAREIESFQAALSRGTPPETAVHDLQTNLSWGAYDYAARHKIEEFFPGTENADLRANLHQHHLSNSNMLKIKNSKTSEELNKNLAHEQNSLALNLASHRLDHELKGVIPDSAERNQFKQPHLQQFQSCLETKTSSDCIQEIETNVAIAALQKQIGSDLPAGLSVNDILQAPIQAHKDCQSKLNPQHPRYAQQVKDCQQNLIIDSVESTALATLNKSIKHYESKLSSPQIAQLQNQIKQNYRSCIQSSSTISTDSYNPSISTELIQSCTEKSAVLAGVQLVQIIGPQYSLKNPSPEPTNPSSLDKFLHQALKTCELYKQANCKNHLMRLEQSLTQQLRSTTSQNPTQTLLQSDFGNQLLNANFSLALQNELSLLLKPHQSKSDKSNYMDSIIQNEIGNPIFIQRILSSSEGQKLISDIKTQMIQNPKYDPAKDARIQTSFKTILMQDTGSPSFTDLVFDAVAFPTLDNTIKSLNSVKRFFVRPGTGDFQNIIKTPKGRQARNVFRTKILIPQMEGKVLTASEMAAAQAEIEKLLKSAVTGFKAIPSKP